MTESMSRDDWAMLPLLKNLLFLKTGNAEIRNLTNMTPSAALITPDGQKRLRGGGGGQRRM